MLKKHLYLLSFFILAFANMLKAQTVELKLAEANDSKSFPLVSPGSNVEIHIDSSDFKVVELSTEHLAKDIELVTESKPPIKTSKVIQAEYALIIGTIDHNKLIDQLINTNKLDIKPIKNKWESFIIASVRNPFPGVKKALVVAGSDRRGTAFGVFTISEAIGVSPWYWWADVTPGKKEKIFIKDGRYIQNSPSVKFRGIFINDEGFGGLNIWAKKTYETDIEDIGSKTYAKVFELMLRLKANYCWPAMHACTKPFYYYPENKKVADDYAIIIGSSHCEQMHCNTMTEWDTNKQGPWNYKINPEKIKAFWKARIELTKDYENIYTLGMRGTEDIEMEGAKNIAEMVEITENSIKDQRNILSKVIKKEPTVVPQILCTYKEVLVTYQNGLNVPEDVTLLWADDNHGYTRQLCTQKEQKRSGGSGVYYHLSLLGTPEGYLWLSTNSPSLIAYEMRKAYEFGADRIWMFNIGDIKPHEKELTFALEMAWDINKWTPVNAYKFIEDWSLKTFGIQTAKDISDLMTEYYLLAAAGKPEHCYRIDYSLSEMDFRITRYRKLAQRAAEIKKKIPDNLKSAYYELIEYPILGCRWMNEMNLLARRSLIKGSAGDETALEDARQSMKSYAQLGMITNYYNKINADGKWNHMMNWHPFRRAKMPEIATKKMIKKAKLSPQGRFLNLESAQLKPPMVFENGVLKNSFQKVQNRKVDNFATIKWESEKEGQTGLWIFSTIPTTFIPSITVEINGYEKTKVLRHIGNIWHTQAAAAVWYKIADFQIKKGENMLKIAPLDTLLQISKIYLGQFPPAKEKFETQVLADYYINKKDGKKSTIEIINGLGLGKGVSVMPFTAETIPIDRYVEAPWTEYKIEVKKGKNIIQIRTLPTQRIHKGKEVQYAVSINNKKPVLIDIQAEEFTTEWQDNVLRGFTIREIPYNAKKNEDVLLRIYLLNPGVVIRDIVLN